MVFAVAYELQEDLSEDEAVLVGFGFTDKVLLVAKTALRANLDEKLND